MANGFTKLFNSIITSSIWSEDDKTRIMWITMLASADSTGHVTGTIPGMAAMARMSLKEAEQSIKNLTLPDSYSRSKEYEGRRLLECEGGWLIANYQKYRQKRDPEKRKEQNREAQERFRCKQKVSQSKPDVSQSKPQSAQAEAEAEAEAEADKRIKDIRQNSNEFRLARLLFNEIRKRKADYKEPNLDKWAIVIGRMIRIDHRLPETIEKVIIWCQSDSGDGNTKWKGWQNNILSASKLREKFDKLELVMGNNKSRQEVFREQVVKMEKEGQI